MTAVLNEDVPSPPKGAADSLGDPSRRARTEPFPTVAGPRPGPTAIEAEDAAVACAGPGSGPRREPS